MEEETLSLTGKVALVTGASRGIGLEIARVLAGQGMQVVMNARSELVEAEAAALQQTGLPVRAIRADISRQAEIESMFDRIETEVGPLWLLVNNAGVLRTGPTAELSEADWREYASKYIGGLVGGRVRCK